MRIFRAYIIAAIVPLLRTPAYWVPLVIFPTLLYSFFGVAPSQNGPELANILLASWSAFAVIGIGFFQFGISIAQARESKWEDYARTLPVGGIPRFLAQIVSAVVFLVMALALLWTVSAMSTPATMNLHSYARLLMALLPGVIPFVLMGAALGYSIPARGAVPVANLLYLPLSYFGGLWIPPQMLPDFVATVSPYTPTRQLGELAWAAVLEHPVPMPSVTGLFVYSAIAALIAVIMWRRDETKRTG
jgi:ABC-2 type transport system permease protein